MKLKEIADIIKGAHLTEGQNKNSECKQKELTMVSLEPISFIDERKVIEVKNCKCESNQLTQVGDVVVSLYYPMIACYVDEGQDGFVVPHYMAIVRVKPDLDFDSRFIVQFINSVRGRRALGREITDSYGVVPTSLPLNYLNNVDIRERENVLLESF
ncbi:hypothetical protein MNB_SV-12-139 [hydrothermal vent metagenome]|uniref:Type I restriction modification DNA specificity domain-containing protein n=1 Tax=hydrothermal vent metagenome TaxID=652676 RepID=A0A1W1CGM4_9ZZZZ